MIKKFNIVLVTVLLLIMSLPMSAMAYEDLTVEIPFAVENSPGTVVIEAVNSEPLPEVTEFADVTSGIVTASYTEPGDYYYRIFQQPGSNEDVTYSSLVYNLLVSVFVDENDNLYSAVTLSVDDSYEKPDSINFINEVVAAPVDSDVSSEPSDNSSDNTGSDSGNNSNSSNADKKPDGDSTDSKVISWLPDTGEMLFYAPIWICIGVLLIFELSKLLRKKQEDSEQNM